MAATNPTMDAGSIPGKSQRALQARCDDAEDRFYLRYSGEDLAVCDAYARLSPLRSKAHLSWRSLNTQRR